MKIPNRLALLLLTASLAACGSDLGGGSKGEPLSSPGAVIIPTTPPTTANKASVGFRVIFPAAAEVAKAALNPAMTKVTITTSGSCGVASLELTPTTSSGVMDLLPGACTFAAVAKDQFNAPIETATTSGTLLGGANNISLTFLTGPWLFVDPTSNEKLPLTLTDNTVLTGIRLQESNGTLAARWFGTDLLNDGPTTDDLMGGSNLQLFPPQLRVTGTFSGGTGSSANLVRLTGAMSNLTDWDGTLTPGARVVQILGRNPNATYLRTYTPATYLDYFTSRVLDGTTLEGNIAEFTFDSHTIGTPYGTCTASAAGAQSAALNEALNGAQKAQTSVSGTVAVTWTECLNSQNVDMTDVYSNITVHPFRAQSAFADPAGALQVEVNSAMANYKRALTTEDPVKGLDLVLLRKAASQFIAAADLAGTNDLSNTANTARFFGAISRLAALGVDTASDGSANGLNDFNDVLDALGAPQDALSRNWSNTPTFPEDCVTVPYVDCRPNFPANSPRSGELLTLLDSKVNTALDLAIADLSKISSSFSYNFIDPSGATTNFDYGDALVLIAAAHGLKAELAIDMAYDLDLDIDATFNGTGPASIQTFMAANPNLGTRAASRYVTELAQAKTNLQTGLAKMKDAIDAIEAEGTGIAQENEFISFYNENGYCDPAITTYCSWIVVNNTAQEIANIRDTIANVLLAVNSTGPITVDDNQTPLDTGDDVILNPSKFFEGISFRSLLPSFTGDVPNGFFPDPSMGGLIVQIPMNINADLDGNGKPDLLEEPHFYSSLVSGKTFTTQSWLNGSSIFWPAVTFNSNGTLSATWDYQNYSVYPPVFLNGTATGTWQIRSDGTLQITVTSGSPLNITAINLSLEYYPGTMEPGFNAQSTVTFADSTTMSNYSWWSISTQPL